MLRRGSTLLFLFAICGCAANDRIDRTPTDAGMIIDGPTDSGRPVDAGCTTNAQCADENRCNGEERCMGGRCLPGAALCDDDVDCTVDSCNADTLACTHAPGTSCGEGLVCDPEEGCVPPVACRDDDDCDDDNDCNGVETCEVGFGCNPGAPVTCDDGKACTEDSCDTSTGECVAMPVHTRCSALACVTRVECDPEANGADEDGCVALEMRACNDDVPCTDDECNPSTGACVYTPVDAMCADTNVCNGAERCAPGAGSNAMGCAPGTAVTCDDMVACTADMCMPNGTCAHVARDGDMDGHAMIGCGSGDDCNDGDRNVAPGAAELCDGDDEDCDGRFDETFMCVRNAPTACTTTCGSTGSRTCNATCSGYVVATCRGTEVCNNCDDDGNGTADDTFMCRRGQGSACTTACGTTGTRTCNDTCDGYVAACRAAAETCGNSCDDDGNGTIDDGCVTAPANDMCANATNLATASGTRTSDVITGATRNSMDCVTALGPEVFYKITLAQKSIAYFDTFGSSFDTVLSVTSTCGTPSVVPTCADDNCSTTQSLYAAVLDAGTYYVAVRAKSAATTTGTIRLRWQTVRAAGGRNASRGSSFTSTAAFTGTSALAGSCAGDGPEDAFFFAFCPNASYTIEADTCFTGSTTDTVLHTSTGTGTRVCRDDDASCDDTQLSYLDTSFTGPGLFVIYVDSFEANTDSYALRATLTPN